jgi:hypothetical protein
MADNEEQLNHAILALQSKLQDINIKMLQLQRQKNSMERREKTSARKARTRRLIQIGALAEKYLVADRMSVVETESLLEKIVSTEEIKSMLAK